MKLTPAPPPPGFRTSLTISYDAVAQQRDEMGEAEWRWPIAKEFLAMLEAENRTRLLEVGAGVGYTSQWFADRGLEVVATDLSPAQVERCRAKGLEARIADLYDLGFADHSFDAVWAMNCVHHIAAGDFAAVLAGVRKVLSPGGLLYVGVWGGRDMEGIYDDDFYPPPRFFCLRSDRTLRRELELHFTIESFRTFLPNVDKDDDGLHMQSVVLRAA